MIHLEVLVEERSAEPVVRRIANDVFPAGATVEVRVFDGKQDLLACLDERLRGYRNWGLDGLRVLVLIDRDDDDCQGLKQRLEAAAHGAGLTTRSTAVDGWFHVCNRIAIEELEAWFLGDEAALQAEFPRLASFANKQRFRDPDAVPGAWEALEKLLQLRGYYRSGLRKVDLATRIAPHLHLDNNRSASFNAFVGGVRSLVS